MLFVVGALPLALKAQDIQWIRQFGTASEDRALGVAVDATGVYVAGYTYGTLPGQVAGGGPAEDAFVRKLDVNGNVLWTRQFGTASRDSALAVAVDGSGVYVGGYTTGTLPGQTNAGGWDAFVRKYDANGAEIWTRQFGSLGDDQVSGVAADATGVYVAGESGNPLPGQSQSFSGRLDAFVRKYDSAGMEIWTRQFGSAGIDRAIGVAADGAAVYVVGETDLALAGQTGSGGYDAFVRKYDAGGTEIWTRQFGTSSTDEAFAVAADVAGVYVGGTTQGTLPGQTRVGFFDAFLRKYDSAGTEQWTRQFGSAASDEIYGVAVDSGGVCVAGAVSGALPGQTAAGGSDAFVRKYDAAGMETWTRQFGTSSTDHGLAVAVNVSGVYVVGDTSGVLTGQSSSGGQDAVVASLSGSAQPSDNAVRAFTIANRGGISLTTDGGSPTPAVGYARIQPVSGSTSPAGVAIFGARSNNILVSETGVPATPALSSGRIYAEVGGAVDTGVAIANPNSSPATITFFYTDASGADLGSGSTVVPANRHVAKFLDQDPFKTFAGGTFQGTFSFTSTVPVGVVALRSYVNGRGDFLMSTLPVIDGSAAPKSGTLVIPHFADGGGWITQILLVNPTDGGMTGSIQFTDDSGAAVNVTVGSQTGSTFAYSVPRRSSQRLATSGPPGLVSGSVRIVPAGGGAAPTPLVVFSYRPLGMVVSEAGVPTLSGTAFRMYSESSGTEGEAGSIQTGIAVANNTSTSAAVTLELTNLDGSTRGLPGPATLNVPPAGHAGRFLAQIFTGLPNPFKGVLRISTTSASISVVALRARFNERGTEESFLITTTPPTVESAAAISGESLFPHLVNGGGYTTQFILFSGFADQTPAGNLRFFRPDGSPFSLAVN